MPLIPAGVDKWVGTMKFRFACAAALSFAVAGCTHTDTYTPTASELSFRNMVNGVCHFRMTWESTREITNALGPIGLGDPGFMGTVLEICQAVYAGKNSKTVEFQLRDRRGVSRKIIIERANMLSATLLSIRSTHLA